MRDVIIMETSTKIINNTMSLTPLSKVPDFIFSFLSAIYLFFSDTYYQLLFLLLFIVVDLISGIALSLHNKQKFEFKKLWITVRKMMLFSIIVFVGFIFDEVFIAPVFGGRYMFIIFMMLLALSEFKSIVNNLGIILKIDVWNLVIKAFKKNTDI